MIDTTKININELHPAEYNPRIMKPSAQLKLKRGIETFGLIDPIIIDLTDNNTIIGGHQRYNALQEIDNNMNLTLIPLGDIGLVIQDTNLKIKDKNDQKAMNISLNNQNLMGDWDATKLEEILYGLEEEDYRIELTGFDTVDLTEEDFEGLDTYYSDEDEYDDEITEASEEPYVPLADLEVTVQRGDKYQLGNHILMCGDSSKMEDIRELIGENKIDVILTDMPYGMGLNTDYSSMQSNEQFYKEKSSNGHGIVYPQRQVDDYNPQFIENILQLDVKETFLWGANYFTQDIPVNDGSWLVWDKRSNENSTLQHTHQMDKMFGSSFELLWSKTRHKQDIIRFRWAAVFGTEKEPDKIGRVHPTQKPVGVSEWILNKYTKTTSNILDLFGGSGSTLLACENTNHNCYMMEIDPHYCQVIINRWEEYTGQKATQI